MTVGAQRLAVDPCLRNSIDGLGTVKAAIAAVSKVFLRLVERRELTEA